LLLVRDGHAAKRHADDMRRIELATPAAIMVRAR
jgi:hypothetical protein